MAIFYLMCVILMDKPIIFTIGHSNRSWDRFLSLLLQNHISIVADIRRFPSSRLWPQFNEVDMKIERIKAQYRIHPYRKTRGEKKRKR